MLPFRERERGRVGEKSNAAGTAG